MAIVPQELAIAGSGVKETAQRPPELGRQPAYLEELPVIGLTRAHDVAVEPGKHMDCMSMPELADPVQRVAVSRPPDPRHGQGGVGRMDMLQGGGFEGDDVRRFVSIGDPDRPLPPTGLGQAEVLVPFAFECCEPSCKPVAVGDEIARLLDGEPRLFDRQKFHVGNCSRPLRSGGRLLYPLETGRGRVR